GSFPRTRKETHVDIFSRQKGRSYLWLLIPPLYGSWCQPKSRRPKIVCTSTLPSPSLTVVGQVGEAIQESRRFGQEQPPGLLPDVRGAPSALDQPPTNDGRRGTDWLIEARGIDSGTTEESLYLHTADTSMPVLSLPPMSLAVTAEASWR